MSSDYCGQGQGGRGHHIHHQRVLTKLSETDDNFQPAPGSISGTSAWQEQRYLSQDSPSYQDMSQAQEGHVQQHLHVKPNHTLVREEKMAVAYSHPAAFSIPQGRGSPPASPGLDGQSLYCTEVLPSASPPSQPVTVEGGGTSRRGLVAVNGGAGNQPVQYTIIITDPQLQQTSSGSSNDSNKSGATSILLNTLVQQQQQQQLQQHLATISQANSNISSLITGAANAHLLINNNSVNGSSKLSSLFISNLSTDVSSASTFPANLIADNQNNSFTDGRNIHIAKVTRSANNKLPQTVIGSAGLEGGIVILNYAEPQLRAGSTAITNINQLVSVHSKVPDGAGLVSQGTAHHLIKAVSDANAVVSAGANRVAAANNTQADLCDRSDISQVNLRARASAVSSGLYNGQVFVEKENSRTIVSKESSVLHSLPVSGEQQLLDPASSSDRVSGGMHSGHTGSGSGQAHSNLPQQQQQQRHSPVSSSSSSTAPATTSSQSAAMLSAGQPAVPSTIFRTGTDSASPSQRLSSSGSASYVPSQYSSIYGIHSQSPGHLTTLPPYSTFFPGFTGSGVTGHSFSHGPLMTGSSQGHYPHIESYSAMLASMGSHVQHRGAQGTERSPRLQAPGVSVTQHAGPFLSASAHLSAAGVQYPSISSSSHRRPSGSGSPSPAPTATTHNPPSAGSHMDPLSSHHLEKMAAIKGGSSMSGREVEVSREMRHYGDAAGLHEDKPSLSPSSSYSTSSHIPKVSFDTVVKEYGGGRDSPTGRGDLYFRPSLSGKEGSLKHRILTRPSDSEMLDEPSKVSSVHGLKDEPLVKRPKLASLASASVAYGAQASHGHLGDSQRSGSRHHSVAQPAAHHTLPNNSNVDTRGTTARHSVDNSLPGRESQQPSPYQHHHSEDSSTDSRYQQQQYHASPTSTPSSLSPSGEYPPSHLQYPSHFVKGSIIQLANGTLKRVEDLQTEDFISSAEISSDLKVDSSTVVRIEEHPSRGTAMLSFSVGEHRVQVTVEATLEHPFFVFGQGWSSCSVSRTLKRYGLECQKLNVGDICISLTHKDVNLRAAELEQQQNQDYLPDPHSRLAMTSSSGAMEHQIPSPLSASSTALPGSSTASSSVHSSTLPSSLKSETTDTSFLPPFPSPTSTSSSKRRLSQTELPPPLSNIVLVKKESNNGHSSHRRSSQRVEDELREEEVLEEEDDKSESALSLRKRRWSAPDPGSQKTEQDQDRERQILASKTQKAEEKLQASSTDNGRQ